MCVYVCVRTCYMLYMRLNYFVGKQHDGRKIPPKFALNPCWDVLERILRKTKWLASWHFGHFVGFLNVFVYFFSISFGFLGIQKMLLLCKIRILVFLLILGLTILLGNTKQQQQQQKLLFFAFPLTSVIFQFLFHGVFWSWFRPHYFFRDLYGYVSESEVARILDEWYAATWLVDFVVCFDSPFYLDLISTHLHVVSCLCEDTDVHLQREVWIYLWRIMLLILFEFCILGEVCTLLSSTVGCSWCLSCTFKQLLEFFALHIYFRGQIKIQWDLKFCQ